MKDDLDLQRFAGEPAETAGGEAAGTEALPDASRENFPGEAIDPARYRDIEAPARRCEPGVRDTGAAGAEVEVPRDRAEKTGESLSPREHDAGETVSRWQREAAETRQDFPDFRMEQELKNPVFRSLLVGGVPIKAAYISLHADEVMEKAARDGMNAAGEKLTRSVLSAQARPLEGAVTGAHASPLRDIRSMNNAQMEDLISRAMRGERIVL